MEKNEFVKECEQQHHRIITCNGCGAPYCATENKCLSEELAGDD